MSRLATGLLFMALVLAAMFAITCIGRDRHPLMVDASACAAKPLPNPCDTVNCFKRDLSKERIA